MRCHPFHPLKPIPLARRVRISYCGSIALILSSFSDDRVSRPSAFYVALRDSEFQSALFPQPNSGKLVDFKTTVVTIGREAIPTFKTVKL